MVYFFVLIIILFCIYQFDIRGRKHDKGVYYNIILILLTTIAGMRYCIGGDTLNYLHEFYSSIPTFRRLKISDLTLTSEPLWLLLNSIVRSAGGGWFVVQFIQALFVNCLVFRYFKKHSQYIFTCALIYFVWMYRFFVFEEMRASISVVLCLFGYDFILENKWIKGYILLFIGCLFHKSTFPLLITPLFFPLLRSNFWSIVLLIITFIISYVAKSQLIEIVGLMDVGDEGMQEKISKYAASDVYGATNKHLRSLFVFCFAYVICPLMPLIIDKKPDEKLLKIRPLAVWGILFVAVQANIEIAYRYVHFYSCCMIVYVAHFFLMLLKRNHRYKEHYNYVFHAFSMGVIVLYFVSISYRSITCWPRYYPYSSVIEKSMTKERMEAYAHEGLPLPQINQY